MARTTKHIGLTASGKSVRVFSPDSGFRTIRVANIEKSYANLMRKSIKLSEQYGGVNKFPDFLGGDKRTPIFAEEAADIVSDVLSGYEDKYSPEEIENAIQQILELGKNDEAFDRAYYGEVAKYYGEPDFSVERTKDALQNKKFKVPVEDLPEYTTGDDPENPERYQRLKDWILDNIGNANARKINQITSGDELQSIMQAYENKRPLDKHYAQRYTRKTTGGRRHRGALKRDW